MSSATCGIMLGDGAGPSDITGCLLPEHHEGRHEFVTTNGRTYLWEPLLTCECDHCRKCEGDYCTIYAEKT
jgi:hypothetical protein